MAKNAIPDPEGKNDQRANHAAGAVDHYARNGGEVFDGPTYLEQNMSDLLCNFAHLCDREEISLVACLLMAQTHYTEETGHEGKQFSFLADVADAEKPITAPVAVPLARREIDLIQDAIETMLEDQAELYKRSGFFDYTPAEIAGMVAGYRSLRDVCRRFHFPILASRLEHFADRVEREAGGQ